MKSGQIKTKCGSNTGTSSTLNYTPSSSTEIRSIVYVMNLSADVAYRDDPNDDTTTYVTNGSIQKVDIWAGNNKYIPN